MVMSFILIGVQVLVGRLVKEDVPVAGLPLGEVVVKQRAEGRQQQRAYGHKGD